MLNKILKKKKVESCFLCMVISIFSCGFIFFSCAWSFVIFFWLWLLLLVIWSRSVDLKRKQKLKLLKSDGTSLVRLLFDCKLTDFMKKEFSVTMEKQNLYPLLWIYGNSISDYANAYWKMKLLNFFFLGEVNRSEIENRDVDMKTYRIHVENVTLIWIYELFKD